MMNVKAGGIADEQVTPAGPSDRLLVEARQHIDAALAHRFFREAIDGSLPDEVFRRYLGIEFAFVDTAARSLGRTVQIAPSFGQRRRLTTALSHLVFDQHDYFQALAQRLGLSLPGADEPPPAGARPLHAHTTGLAEAGEYLPMLAGFLGAEWLYATWCSEAVTVSADRDPDLQDWIDLHVDASFVSHVAWLRGELDHGIARADTATYAACLDAFTGTVDAEIPFHDAAYEDDGSVA